MTGILLQPIGPVPDSLCDEVARFLGQRLECPVRVGTARLDPEPAFDPVRKQYNCRPLLAALEELAGPGERVLGVTGVDLFSPVFTFVFGEARLGGAAGLFSINRLRPSSYGMAEDRDLLLARARTEALHETGHMLGLVHCRQNECAMRFSSAAEEIDLKTDRYCPECLERSRELPAKRVEPGGVQSPR